LSFSDSSSDAASVAAPAAGLYTQGRRRGRRHDAAGAGLLSSGTPFSTAGPAFIFPHPHLEQGAGSAAAGPPFSPSNPRRNLFSGEGVGGGWRPPKTLRRLCSFSQGFALPKLRKAEVSGPRRRRRPAVSRALGPPLPLCPAASAGALFLKKGSSDGEDRQAH
jgi:hypothetical protein